MRVQKKNIRIVSQINTNKNLREGHSIEEILRQYKADKSPVDVETVPEIFQERSAGVDPMCDIRTDRMELAQRACDQISRTHMLARANRGDMGEKESKDFTYVTDTDGNIVKNPSLNQRQQ